MTEYRDSPLSARRVGEVFEDCADVAHTCNTVDVQGIVHTARFSLVKLLEHKAEIGGMLAQLPVQFFPNDRGGGGGWSFLNACMDRDGTQWTGLHLVMEQLVLLGIATDQVQWCMPREMWKVLPGEMPYFQVVTA